MQATNDCEAHEGLQKMSHAFVSFRFEPLQAGDVCLTNEKSKTSFLKGDVNPERCATSAFSQFLTSTIKPGRTPNTASLSR
jgi:hypothetical protein